MGLIERLPTADADPFADAMLAARLLAVDPAGLGGICLRAGAGDGGERVIAELRARLPAGTPVRTMPSHIDDERLLGGIDVAASLTAGRRILSSGLLAEAAGGVIVIPSAERMGAATAGRIATWLDSGGGAVVLLDHGVDGERPPATLLERVAFDLTPQPTEAPPLPGADVDDDEALATVAGVAAALGVASIRATLFALRAARTAAALDGRSGLRADDLALAARLVLAPRATQLPAPPPAADEEPDQPPTEPQSGENKLEDVVLDAARAVLPPDILAALAGDRATNRTARSGGAGQKQRSPSHGRPVGVRAGLPGAGRRLALIETLRAAAPWQRLRAKADGGEARLRLRRSDLRIRRYEDKSEALAVIAVDASGSSARTRLAEAKGAIELLLAQAYAKRVEVALVVFRGTGAEILLPPTRSLTRARKLLAELPGGGGTPLAAGLDQARALAQAGKVRGRTPHVVVLTDGRANIAADGSPGRGQAETDALAAAKRLAGDGFRATVIDISPREQPEAARVADAMRARYLQLPRADAAAVHAAIGL